MKHRLAYVHNNNVYVHLEGKEEPQLTWDGKNGVIYNGVPDWVYEEEVFGTNNALWWSPDSNYLAIGVFNDSNVQTFKYAIYEKDFHSTSHQQYPIEINLKYPKAGTSNPMVFLKVFHLATNTSVEIRAPVDIVTNDHILRSVTWSSDTELLVLWLNRRQNKATMQKCSIAAEVTCEEVTHPIWNHRFPYYPYISYHRYNVLRSQRVGSVSQCHNA